MKRLVLPLVVGLYACGPDIAPKDDAPDLGTGGSPPTNLPPGKGGSGPVMIPEFTEPVVVADVPPPPISGGTLLVSSVERWAAVSDPDHDQLVIVDLDEKAVTATIALEPGDEPGRLVEDGAGKLHVVLRRGGGIATVDPTAGTLLERRAVCAYPRGLAYDATSDSLLVACAEGLLVSLPAAGGAATRNFALDRDLRDVVVENGNVWVSSFRRADVLLLDAQGQLVQRFTPPILKDIDLGEALSSPNVAWRMVADPSGGVLVVHQRSQQGEIFIEPGGYGSGTCGGIVETAVTHFEAGAQPETSTLGFPSALTVDVAADGDELLFASAGAMPNGELGGFFPAITSLSRGQLLMSSDPMFNGCTEGDPGTSVDEGQAVAVAYDDGVSVIQLREPSTLVVGTTFVTLPGDSRADTGHLLFHAATSVGLACASCHPEGREDGHTWNFSEVGPRRTQSIGGMLTGTEPFHWGGDEPTFGAIVKDVMTGRMAGPEFSTDHANALFNWIESIPAWSTPASADATAVERGKTLFESESVACATCHAGESLTDNRTYEVGTGAAVQVPSLRGVVWRAPYIHNGCAQTLADRFGECGGDKHGDVSALTDAELGDLLAYLESL